MLLKPLALAATAAALLVLPDSHDDTGDDVFKALPIHAEAFVLPATASSQDITVPCAGCGGRDSQLKLALTIADGTKLMANGFELYPNADPLNAKLSAGLVDAGSDEEQWRLGYSLSVEPQPMDQDMQMQVVDVKLQVLQVGDNFVKGVPMVKVQLVRAAASELAIGNVELMPAEASHCTTASCRAKQLLGDIFKSLKGFAGKGCPKLMQSSGANMAEKGHAAVDATPAHGRHPHSHGHKGPHHRPHHRYGWRKLLKNVASHIFLPILMGITAGVGVAVFAMVLCSTAVRVMRFTGRKRAGRGRCCRSKQKSAARDAEPDVEKVGLMEENHEEPPPQYMNDESKN